MKKILIFIGLVLAAGCQYASQKEENKAVDNPCTALEKEAFKTTVEAKTTQLYKLQNNNQMCVGITNYGGRIVSLVVPDKNGEPVDVVVGFGSIDDYLSSTEKYFGALIGRVGNRIANGRFTIDGTEYTIPQNNGENTLHGGEKGFQDVVWDATQRNDSVLELTYFSEDGEEGFPGNLQVKVVYSLTSDNGLRIEYEAETDQRTPVNLTSHPFFNLNGEGSGKIVDHKLMIDADYFTPVDDGLIPTGELREVEGTPFDFTEMTAIGARLDTTANAQLKYGKGYDHNYVLNKTDDDKLFLAARVIGDKTGIEMEVLTEEPGLQFYSGNFMQSQNTFKNGSKDAFRTAFCLETQHFPDAPNQPDFPSIMLEEDSVYETVTIYRFNTK